MRRHGHAPLCALRIGTRVTRAAQGVNAAALCPPCRRHPPPPGAPPRAFFFFPIPIHSEIFIFLFTNSAHSLIV